MIDQDEVNMIRGPAHHEDSDDYSAHPDYLQRFVIASWRGNEFSGYPPLVLPALVHRCRRNHHQLEDALRAFVEAVTHLREADGHAD